MILIKLQIYHFKFYKLLNLTLTKFTFLLFSINAIPHHNISNRRETILINEM